MNAREKKASDLKADIKDVAKELEKLSSEVEAETSKEVESVKRVAKQTAKTAKTAAAKTATKAKQTATQAKETAKKVAASAKKKDIHRKAVLEMYGNQVSIDDLMKRAEAAHKAESKTKGFTDIKLYIKPEDNAAYYVIDDSSVGRVDLF